MLWIHAQYIKELKELKIVYLSCVNSSHSRLFLYFEPLLEECCQALDHFCACVSFGSLCIITNDVVNTTIKPMPIVNFTSSTFINKNQWHLPLKKSSVFSLFLGFPRRNLLTIPPRWPRASPCPPVVATGATGATGTSNPCAAPRWRRLWNSPRPLSPPRDSKGLQGTPRTSNGWI